MELSENNNDAISLNDLFPDGDYSSIFGDISFSDNLQLEDNNPNQYLPPFFPNDADPEYPSTTDENNLLELHRLLPETQQVIMAILAEGSLMENSTVHENSNVTNISVLQQANDNQDGIIYQMHPSLFDSIDGVMSVKQQPKANNRSRYQCDGSRFLPDSRYHPMSINLPDLNLITLGDNQTLGIVMTMVTNTNNPHHQPIVHANDLIYRAADAVKIAYGCVFVPLENLDIQNNEKKFPRSSIIYKKCDEYTFDLTPFNTSSMFGPTEKYVGKNKKKTGNAAKAKDFKEDYKLLSYKIVFQLALKQDNTIFISNITCETETIDEQKPATTGKRSASFAMETPSEEESSLDTQISGPSKKFKSSTPSMTGLPVTRVSNHDTATWIINNDLS